MRKSKGRLCDVEGCGKPHKAHGLCRFHYSQTLKSPICKKCGGAKINELRTYCKACQAEYSRAWSNRRRDKRNGLTKFQDELLDHLLEGNFHWYTNGEREREDGPLDLSEYDEQLMFEMDYYERTGKFFDKYKG